MNVTDEEKERFCAVAAALLAPPDEVLAEDLQQEALLAWLDATVREWGAGRGAPSESFREAGQGKALAALRKEYGRLFTDTDGEQISLVESTYKPWTLDKGCGLAFAASQGLVMGDSALHMTELYERLSLEIPEAFRSTPDHLVLELEFLALLYRSGAREQVGQFIADHLDWIEALRQAVEKANPHPFYRNAILLVDSFLQNEVRKQKVN